MKIVHLCVSNFYVDGYSYQENELIREHVRAGHDVKVIASTETIGPNGKLTYTEARNYLGSEGARVTRISYLKCIPSKIVRKMRVHSEIFQLLEEFDPDVILFHSLCSWELLTVAKYKRTHPKVLFYADSHEDWNNSAQSFVSREILHKRYYGPILRRALPQIEKLLCISTETMDFVEEVYSIDRDKLEFFPLGGHPVPDQEYAKLRKTTRESLGVKDDQTMFVQSGKQTIRKKLIDSLKAFAATPEPNFRLFIVGILFDDIREEAQQLIDTDPRVTFLGWKSASELAEILIAADIYLQPGTQSVTMQSSLCAHCAVIIDDVKSHAPYIRDNGWLINENYSLAWILADVSKRKSELKRMQDASYQLALEFLDYSKLAKRILS
ncbi:MAG: glycosyltransferase family 4 protein [Rhizobiaceae bacterium]|nr:glycosyltransferase family 4 protein [Rhizobiaceae bacterium]